jgi:soluble lytic murein transglycosylase-like protein
VQGIVFCSRCRGMKVGWNVRYLNHRIRCKDWISKPAKLFILTALLAVLVLGFPTPSALVFSGDATQQPVRTASIFQGPVFHVNDPAVRLIGTFLKGYDVDETHRNRVAESIVTSSKKYNMDPRLIASVVVVESRANPFAISNRDSIGIMQIHIPTWGPSADREGINLFKIEDNIDFGTRILRDYVRQSGLWDGVKRYKGYSPDVPESEQGALDYVAKVQRVYGFQEQTPSSPEILQ